MTDHNRVRRTRRGTAKLVHPALILAICAALILAACGGKPGAQSVPQPSRDSVTIAHPQEPSDWNYLRNDSTIIRNLLVLNVVEPLLEKQKDGTFTPLLAESYQASNDGLVYTFKIRDAVFHTGARLTADDVVYSLQQSKAASVQDVSGPFEAVRQISKTDARAVAVTLSRPSQRFLEAMSSLGGLIIPKGSANNLNAKPVGTGPFTFRGWRHGVAVDLARNDQYWGNKPPLKTVTWRFITDTTASINALRSGDVDWIAEFAGNPAQADSVAGTPGFAKQVISGRGLAYVSLNANDPAFSDIRVRQAIAYSIDTKGFMEAAGAGGIPTCVFVNPPTEPWNTEYCPYPFNPDKAKQLLTEAGKQGVTLRYTYLAGFPEAIEFLIRGLEQTGFKVKREGLEFATYLDRVLTKGQYQLTSIAGDQQIDSWKCPGFFTHDCFPEMDKLLMQADRSLDRTEWANLRRQAVEKSADRAFLIPTYTANLVSLYRQDVSGIKDFSSSSEIDLRGLRVGG